MAAVVEFVLTGKEEGKNKVFGPYVFVEGSCSVPANEADMAERYLRWTEARRVTPGVVQGEASPRKAQSDNTARTESTRVGGKTGGEARTESPAK